MHLLQRCYFPGFICSWMNCCENHKNVATFYFFVMAVSCYTLALSRAFASIMRLEKKILHFEMELSKLVQDKIDLKAHLIDAQRLNRDQQQTIWGLQRALNNPLTHASRITQLATPKQTF